MNLAHAILNYIPVINHKVQSLCAITHLILSRCVCVYVRQIFAIDCITNIVQ